MSAAQLEIVQRQLLAKSQGLVVLPEFDFKHCIYQLTEQVLSGEGLKYAFSKCSNYLKLKENPDLGLTVLVSTKWVMVSLIKAPYVKVGEDTDIFLDGFAYAGMIQLQSVGANWP
jgi:hypothetical protein